MLVLGLDLATRTGWAAGEPGSRPRTGSVNLGSKKAPWARMSRRERDYALGWFLRDLFKEIGVPHAVAIEHTITPPPEEGRSNHATGQLLARLNGSAFGVLGAWHIETIEEVAVMSWRKHFTGRGGWGSRDASKNATMKRCRQLGYEFENDNEADACGVWDWMVHAHMRHPTTNFQLFAP